MRRAIDGGVDGIYCSNHGGRQANGGAAAIDLLARSSRRPATSRSSSTPACAAASTSSRRWRSARRAVGIGRPYAYGLAVGGEDGIVHVLRSLLAEADLLMAVDGYASVADLTPEALSVR